VKLSAFHQGGSVVIHIEDDGRGLDAEKVRKKAVSQGLIRPDEELTPDALRDLIFRPGFSTADQVTDVSGRGVGMDVVRTNIEALNGSISLESEPGRGTRFRISLPLTLAIIDGMVVRIGEERYVFPMLSVVRIVTCARQDRFTVKNRGEMISLQGQLVPLFPLEGYFRPAPASGGGEAGPGLLLVAESEGRKAAFPVDELLGQQQIVIKKLEAGFPEVPGLTGGAILPDGRVSLILDLDNLIKLGF
jgi:two-component system chemotaxis sensor kinase CheA